MGRCKTSIQQVPLRGLPPCLWGGCKTSIQQVPLRGLPPCLWGGCKTSIQQVPLRGLPPCLWGGCKTSIQQVPLRGLPPCLWGGVTLFKPCSRASPVLFTLPFVLTIICGGNEGWRPGSTLTNHHVKHQHCMMMSFLLKMMSSCALVATEVVGRAGNVPVALSAGLVSKMVCSSLSLLSMALSAGLVSKMVCSSPSLACPKTQDDLDHESCESSLYP